MINSLERLREAIRVEQDKLSKARFVSTDVVQSIPHCISTLTIHLLGIAFNYEQQVANLLDLAYDDPPPGVGI